MAPALTTVSVLPEEAKKAAKVLPAVRPTNILHRTPWRPPVATKAKGMTITLEDGTELYDAVGGAAVVCIGHGNEEVKAALKEQVDKLSYVYNMQLSNEPAEQLADLLITESEGAFELVGFLSGGSEAVEAAIKLARQYFHETGQTQRTHFIARHLSFHGNTLATLALASNPARRAPYEAVLEHDHFHHVSPAYAARFQKEDESEEAYVERLRAELEAKFVELGPDTVIGFVAETVVGATTGALPPPKGYFKAVKSVCDKYGALFILDEVMSGMGRMGTLHAWESFGDGVAPDIEACAKGLGGGYASIGAVLMNKRVADGIRDGSSLWKHGHTYQGHAMACAASLAVQKIIARDDLLANCRSQGAYLSSLLRTRLCSANALAAPYAFNIRGGGLFWGIEWDYVALDALPDKSPGATGTQFAMLVQARCMERGLVIMGFTGGSNLAGTEGSHNLLSPAYTVTKAEVEGIVDRFVGSVEEVLREKYL